MSYDRVGDAVVGTMETGFILLCIAVPLAIWKLVDIVIWLWRHIEIGVK
jgi:hypothetical protein